MYADDILLYLDSSITSINNGVEDFNTDLNNISLWATAHGLRINPKKSKYIVIRKKFAKIESIIDVFLFSTLCRQIEPTATQGLLNKSRVPYRKLHTTNRTYYILITLVLLI